MRKFVVLLFILLLCSCRPPREHEQSEADGSVDLSSGYMYYSDQEDEDSVSSDSSSSGDVESDSGSADSGDSGSSGD